MEEEDIKRGIIILALDNLIYTYKSALEENLNEEYDTEEMNFIIDAAQIIMEEMGQDLKKPSDKIERPRWKKH